MIIVQYIQDRPAGTLWWARKKVLGSNGPATMTKNGTCDSKYKQKNKLNWW